MDTKESNNSVGNSGALDGSIETVNDRCFNVHVLLERVYISCRIVNTGLFISPYGTSKLDCATTKTYTAERSISIGRESLKVFCTRGLGVLAGSTARG